MRGRQRPTRGHTRPRRLAAPFGYDPSTKNDHHCPQRDDASAGGPERAEQLTGDGENGEHDAGPRPKCAGNCRLNGA